MEAYEIYAGTVKERLPRIYVAITGKGPEKQTYQRIIEERSPHWRQIMIQLLWLEVDDYPK
jgi:beta-1,4-mannosyltransferase